MLRRRGRLGLRLDDGLVRAVAPGGPADRAGLRAGDVLNIPRDVLSRCRAGESVTLAVLGREAVSVAPDPWPEERWPGCDVRYEEVPAGLALRAITVAPPGATATVLYLPGADLHSVERAEAGEDDPLRGWVAALLRAGYAVRRVERRGVGDSEGDDPGATAWATEREDLRAALRTTEGARVVLFGHSLGAMHAAALAGEDPRVQGVVMYGAGLDPWDDYLDANLRRQLALAQEPDADAVARAVMEVWARAWAGEDVRDLVAAQGDRAQVSVRRRRARAAARPRGGLLARRARGGSRGRAAGVAGSGAGDVGRERLARDARGAHAHRGAHGRRLRRGAARRPRLRRLRDAGGLVRGAGRRGVAARGGRGAARVVGG
ncbi:MAG: alpha/beta fold hydrolase [Polyangiales bacterium]